MIILFKTISLLHIHCLDLADQTVRLATHTQNDCIILQKTLIFLCMLKISLIIHFFVEILLHFQEYCNLTGQQHFVLSLENQNFAGCGIGREIAITIVFTVDYFQEKLIKTFFKKFKSFFVAILGLFWPNLDKIFPEKKGFFSFWIFQLSNDNGSFD